MLCLQENCNMVSNYQQSIFCLSYNKVEMYFTIFSPMFSRFIIFSIVFLYPVFVLADSNFIKDIKSEKFFRNHDISLYGVSWTNYLLNASTNKTDGFKNQLFMIGISIDDAKKTKFVLGTLKNNYDNNCFVIGASRDWIKIN